ncbi:MAG: glycosyltransferase family 2 protein [Bacteroidetes bacterium]|nr:glycosyltransferase family 2 protein [Bacteroidota bacterium]
MSRTISIVTVVLNDKEGFLKTAQSVMEQDYPEMEWIVIDGGSTDGTADAIKDLDGRISCLVSEPDGGFYDAMNKGLEKATGEWVNFMNSGDVFAEDHVIAKIMSPNLSDIGVVYGDALAKYFHGPVLKKACTPDKLDQGMGLCHQSVFVRTDLAKMAGFDLQYRIGADYDHLMKIRSKGIGFMQVPYAVALIDTAGISNRKMALSAREHFQIVQKYRKLTIVEKLWHVSFIAWVSLVSTGYRFLPERVMHRMARLK